MPSGRADPSLGIVADLWRFPVKSLGGERLRRAFIGPFGMLGDRRYAVGGADGPLTARTAHRLLGFRAIYANPEAVEHVTVITPAGEALSVADGALAGELGQAVGAGVSIEQSPLGFFDAAPLQILGEPSIAALSESTGSQLDRRRFRANVLVDPAGGTPFEEDGWVGRRLIVGDAVVEVVVNTERCAVTTFDPDTLERSPAVLRALATTRDNLLGVYARVLRPGWVRTGDRILPAPPG